MNEDPVLRTLSTVAKNLSSVSFPSQTQMFVFESSAGVSPTPLQMPESIVKMSMTSYSSESMLAEPKKTSACFDDSAIAPTATATVDLLLPVLGCIAHECFSFLLGKGLELPGRARVSLSLNLCYTKTCVFGDLRGKSAVLYSLSSRLSFQVDIWALVGEKFAE